MEPHEELRPDEGHPDANGSTFGLLPRPCSMPSFDRNADAVGKKNLQTLPPKCSAKKGLVGIQTSSFNLVGEGLREIL